MRSVNDRHYEDIRTDKWFCYRLSKLITATSQKIFFWESLNENKKPPVCTVAFYNEL